MPVPTVSRSLHQLGREELETPPRLDLHHLDRQRLGPRRRRTHHRDERLQRLHQTVRHSRIRLAFGVDENDAHTLLHFAILVDELNDLAT